MTNKYGDQLLPTDQLDNLLYTEIGVPIGMGNTSMRQVVVMPDHIREDITEAGLEHASEEELLAYVNSRPDQF